jgi:hypothetical protein
MPITVLLTMLPIENLTLDIRFVAAIITLLAALISLVVKLRNGRRP